MAKKIIPTRQAATPRPPARPPARPAAPPPPARQEPSALPRNFATNTSGNSGGVAKMDDVDKMMYQDAGLGVSTRPSDNITPSIVVLQPLSPSVLAGPAKIEGAEAGDFLVRGASNPLIPGQDGIWFQPVSMTEHWFEFVPRDLGGGFVARYDVDYDAKGRIIPPDGAVQDETNQNSYSFPDSGNNCIHYRFIAGFVWTEGIGLEYVIPFHGTGHTVARTWNTKWTRKRFADGKMMPAYSHLYHLTTSQKTNKKGTWFQIDVSEGTHLRSCADIVVDLGKSLQMGRALAQAFERGEKLAGAPEDDGEKTTVIVDGVDDNKEIPY